MAEEKTKRKHVYIDPATGELDLKDLPDPSLRRSLIDSLSMEFAFEPLDQSTLEKMDAFVITELEKL
ncbi:MAG: hypothetical protein PQJ50_18680 [Spirochaetales bacterium]|nr:hypothetical protein [Spirochaetales bacterium]